MYYTAGHFFCKSATGCLVHHYSQFDGNYTLENLYVQFDGNYTLENLYGQFDGNYMFFKLMGKDGGTRAFFPYIGANKHHRQRKFVRRSTKHSGVQSTCKMSMGWMMCRELRSEGLVGRARRAMA